MKRCNKCHRDLPRESFTKSSKSPDGLAYSCRECHNAHCRQRWANDPEYRARIKRHNSKYCKNLGPEARARNRAYALRYNYGLETRDLTRLYRIQGGKCAICQKPESEVAGKRLHVDHDHKTGTVRGLLCRRCNRGIGLLHDDRDILYAALRYLNSDPPLNLVVKGKVACG